jgi:hypothetical protein
MSQLEARHEFLDLIRGFSDATPSMRIGQLVAAIGEICSDLHSRGLWDAEDHELLEAARKFQRGIESNLPAGAPNT